MIGSQSMVAPLRSVIVKRPEEAFRNREAIEKEWKPLGYTRPPDLERASRDHRQFTSLLEAFGAKVLCLPTDERTGLDSIYTHDPVLITDRGAILFQTGKPARRGEGPAFADAFGRWDVPILGIVEGAATAEAGDMVWLDRRTLLVGRGFRTNASGIETLSSLVKPLGVTVISVELPYWNGPEEVLHLMSFVSLLDDNLAVVYRRAMPVPLFELFNEKGIQLVDVPDEEYPTLGCNVLALSPRNIVMVGGNPVTRKRLEAAACEVSEFDGTEICLPGAGGPTCLTRPLWRSS
ncbi:MAG TPA: arginine deiminase family protein [Terriglobia bacterium]|nr:arginine deiminase family protein [Terriglobia bacterium]